MILILLLLNNWVSSSNKFTTKLSAKSFSTWRTLQLRASFVLLHLTLYFLVLHIQIGPLVMLLENQLLSIVASSYHLSPHGNQTNFCFLWQQINHIPYSQSFLLWKNQTHWNRLSCYLGKNQSCLIQLIPMWSAIHIDGVYKTLPGPLFGPSLAFLTFTAQLAGGYHSSNPRIINILTILLFSYIGC